MFFKRNKNQVGGITYQQNGEAPIDAHEIASDKVKSIIAELKNGEDSKPHINADMTTSIKLDTDELSKSINELTKALSTVPQYEGNADKEHQPKIHELPVWQQARSIYAHNHMDHYNVYIDDPEILELLSKPNTRLAIIEDDEDETV